MPLVYVRSQQLTPSAPGGGGAPVAGYDMWHKADAIVGLNDNDPVTTWEDSSANNWDLTQATAGKKPLYKTGIVNGKPAILFDGTDDELEVSPSSPIFVNDQTVFIVASLIDHPTVTQDIGVCGSRTLGTYGCIVWRRRDADGNGLGFYSAADAEWRDTTDVMGFNTWHVVTFVFDASNLLALRIDGVEQYTSGVSIPAGPWSPNPFRVGTGRTVNTNPSYAHCYIAEFLAYGQAVLSGADLATVETYLKSKYGIA